MDNGTVAEPETIRCSECNSALTEGQDRETTEDAVFCRPCFNNLTAQLQQAVAQQGQDINYSMAAVGGLAGAAVGVLVWWGFTVVTNISFGLVAVVIGFAVGKGVVMLSGDKRSQGLQITSVIISILGFVYASYLVNRTFIMSALAEQGETLVLPWIPAPDVLFNVLELGFGFMDVVFLAIVVYEAWKIPAPFRIGA
jgi:hypothetical protein